MEPVTRSPFGRCLGLCIWLLSAMAFGAADGPPGKRILILGDSLTEGYGIAKEAAYPAVLERELNKAESGSPQPRVQVINGGISGSTSASGPSRLRWHLKVKPDVVVIALGANDGLRGRPVQEMEKDLDKTLELAKAAGTKVVLAGMKMPFNYGEEYRQAYEAAFARLHKKHKVAFVPFLLEGVGGDPKMNIPDGIHPNEAGNSRIAKNLLPTLEKILREDQPSQKIPKKEIPDDSKK